ncbi:hypothetical protein HAX54_025681 [Datura stramonium]|uniref:Uncharacterized protein n=1 Tax=Datura stramonium TaxID=4076 RepID=A0ABS8V1Z6_DATST|nr:hypothetical protein [Datura stramonium]
MADEERNLIEILEENSPIDFNEYIRYVSSPKCGAIATFAVSHCFGTVPVGETSVFVAISSVHQADSLDACKFLIDELKASVPIWKKEVY